MRSVNVRTSDDDGRSGRDVCDGRGRRRLGGQWQRESNSQQPAVHESVGKSAAGGGCRGSMQQTESGFPACWGVEGLLGGRLAARVGPTCDGFRTT
jgi:hypothetical protein